MKTYLLSFVLFCMSSVLAQAQTIVITLHEPLTMEMAVFSQYIEPGYEAKDSAGNDYTEQVIVDTGFLKTDKLGYFQVIYSIPESIGNAEPQTRIIHVIDTVKPIIILTGNDTLCFHLKEVYTDPGVEAQDNYEGTISAQKIIDMPKDSQDNYFLRDSICYTILYVAKDLSGNVSDTARRTACVCYGPNVGVESITESRSSIHIYPNPATDILNIDRALTGSTVTISDMLGKMVYSGTAKTIDVRELRKGFYFITVKDGMSYQTIQKVFIH